MICYDVADNEVTRTADGPVHGIGYEGRTPDELIESRRGRRAGRRRRAPPPGEPQAGLLPPAAGAALAAAGIGYVHEPSLGNPPENRDVFPAATRSWPGPGRAAGPGADAVARIAARAAEEPVALLCVERDDDRCHRRVVADLVAERLSPGRGPRARGHPRGR